MYSEDTCQNTDSFLEHLYVQYCRFVYNEAWKYHSNEFDVDDLVQEVWLNLCNKSEVLRSFSKAQMTAYLSVAVRHTAISVVRRQHAEISLEEINAIAYCELDYIHENVDRTIRIQLFRQLWPTVPPRTREILERKYILQESDEEIALHIGVRKNSVRTYLTRARREAYAILHGQIREHL